MNVKHPINNKNTQISQNALKEAHKIVVADLTNALVKMKPNQSVRLNGIGTFTKKKRTMQVNLEKTPNGKPNKLYGKTIQYYTITFKTSQTLKRAIDK